MSAHAAPAPGGRSLTIRGRSYPVLLPKLSDPRLHLAVVITSLQVLGQVAFEFRLSIAQILLAIGTCAVLEVGITLRKQHVLMWPASAMLTGNGVAFILRVPGTEHGDWWSLNGWWIYVGTAAVSLLSKYVITWRGGHVFNPSNFGLVLCFLALGRTQAEPLDFWWGPMSLWLALATAIIVAGGLAILSRLRLLVVAVAFWLAFAAGVAVLALSGHAIVARWHLGPVDGFYLWRILLTSPEILVFLFFMITDPKTTPKGRRARAVYGAGIGLLAALLIAPVVTEYATKVGVLAALAIVCAVRPFLPWLLARLERPARSRLVPIGAAAGAAYVLALVVAGGPTGPDGAAVASAQAGGGLPSITILPSRGVDANLDLPNARAIARGLGTGLRWGSPPAGGMRVWLEPGEGQDPPVAVAQLASNRTYQLHLDGSRWVLGGEPTEAAPGAPPARSVRGVDLENVADMVGLRFRHSAFAGGVTNDPQAMMGGGVCWLDYDDDGWIDLFVVNSYADSDISAEDQLPQSRLFRNDHGRFVDATRGSGAGVRVKGEGCVAADLDGDGRTDLYVTTAVDDVLLWNDGDGTFTNDARRSGVVSFGWHSGAAVADVNGDGRQDLFVAGYTDVHNQLPASMAGFPANHVGVRDLLFLNLGHRRFREVGRRVGLDRSPYDHSLGAAFRDFDGDGRVDLYVANDLDPNRLYLNRPGGPVGFRLVDAARAEGVADPNAGMGVAAADYTGDGRADLFVSNSRGQTHAVYASRGEDGFAGARGAFEAALGPNLTGWGDAWADLDNDGRLDLVLANGAIPVTDLAKDAGPVQVLAQRADRRFVRADVVSGLRLNGRGVAAADYDNDGDLDLAVASIGGPLALLRNTGPYGHWLEVAVRPFAPGATVTVLLADGRRLVRDVQAGSSYLSSEDPRVHFGLGAAGAVREVTVRYPDGTLKRLVRPRADRLLTVRR